MSWFRGDDRDAFAQWVLEAGNAAVGCWYRMSTWSNGYESDGVIPSAIATTIASPAELDALVAVGAIVPHGAEFEIVGHLDRNFSKEEAIARRAVLSEKRAAAGRLGGIRSGEVRRSNEANDQAKTKQLASSGEANGQASVKQLASEITSKTKPRSRSRSRSRSRPDPTPTETQSAPSAPLTLTGERSNGAPKKMAKERGPKHTPEKIATKGRIVDAFIAGVKSAKGIEPKLTHAGEHRAAFDLAKTYGEEAVGVVTRALADPFVLGSNCTLRYIAGKADTWRGTATPQRTNGRLLQHEAPPGEMSWLDRDNARRLAAGEEPIR